VLPLGDSITWGQGSPSHSSYRAELWRLVGGQTRYAVRFVGSQRSGNLPQPQNEGHRGYTITRIRTRLDGWMAAARPDVVLLHIGINDLSRHVGPVHASDRLAELIDRIYADRPGVSVVLMGLIPTSRPLQSQAKTYNERAAALQGAERLRGRSFWYVVPPALTRAEMKDRLHPNDAGYARIAHAFFPALSSAAAARATATARAA
jgi:lysophospholipase L1-like esterase